MSAVDRMLDRFAVLYGPPNTDATEEFIGEYHRTLTGYAEDVIDLAATMVIDEQDRPFWPTPGKVRQAARQAASKIEYNRFHRLPPPGRPALPPPTEQQKIFANTLTDELRKSTEAMSMSKKIETPNVSKPAFEELQAKSANQVHRTLSGLSRRMTGETE